jgi:hypothetical protein
MSWRSGRFSRALEGEFFPGLLMFGSTGAGEYVAFDARIEYGVNAN